MTDKAFKILILIINNDHAETAIIKTWLENDMRLPWAINHCMSVEEARSCVDEADLVILKPEMVGSASPKEVFKHINDMVFEVPILVLTSEGGENRLSTFVMEHGAADTVIRGQFARLVDAIEFALIRQKLKSDARKSADQTLSDFQYKSKADLKTINDENLAEQERQKQILRMFSGDYAVDERDKTNP